MKLILVNYWGYGDGEGAACGTNYFPFEYSSKEDFVLMVLEQNLKKAEENPSHTILVKMFTDELYLTGYDIIEIENNVYTLDEWFERNKKVVAL